MTAANPNPRTGGAPPVTVSTAGSLQGDGIGTPHVGTKGGWAVGSPADLSRKPAEHGMAGGGSCPPASAQLRNSSGSFNADTTLTTCKAKEKSENGTENVRMVEICEFVVVVATCRADFVGH